MPRIERVIVAAQGRKIPGPQPYHMEEIWSAEYHLAIDASEDAAAVEAAIKARMEAQNGQLARQEALLRKRWSQHGQTARVPTTRSTPAITYNPKDLEKSTLRLDAPPELRLDGSHDTEEIFVELKGGKGMVPASDVDVSRYDPKLQEWFRDVTRDLEKATGSPARVTQPATEADLKALCQALSEERKRLGTRPKWQGHDHPDYPKGASMAAKDRRCSYEHCDGRHHRQGRAISDDEWDWSIRNQGRPLCRPCQKVAPHA